MANQEASSLGVKENMRKIISDYCRIRGLPREKISVFWDCLILTTADEDQTQLYENIIRNKIRNGHFPSNLPYFIYADPPGYKIGSGGSVLYSLSNLYKEWSDDLYEKKILFICVGGQSQRLPTGTFLGKLSLSLPIDEENFDMFDLKIALYLPFAFRMKAGVFVTCSDDIETYASLDEKNWTFENEGFTALGHLSSVDIGKQHGVYVLSENYMNFTDGIVVNKCQRVLQKPSYEQMIENGAILKDERVCTDSAFFFDHNISRKFVNYMSDGKRITNEIDAYRDFLQPLGQRAPTISEKEHSMLIDLHKMLHKLPLTVILLVNSNFYHLGTMREYVDNLSVGPENNQFFQEMGLNHFSHSACLTEFKICFYKPTVMNSVVGTGVKFGPGVVLDWCRVASSAQIGNNCIISHCDIISASPEETLIVPPNCCFHTVAVLFEESVKFVTIAFQIDDNIKKFAKAEKWAKELKFMNVNLEKVCHLVGIELDELFPDEKASEVNLWGAKLFPIFENKGESFRRTLELVQCVLTSAEITAEKRRKLKRFSLRDLVEFKCVDSMLEFEKQLSDQVSSRMSEHTI